MRLRVVSILVACALLPAAWAADWPGWRGADGSGVSPEKGLPTHWSATQNIRWKVPLRGAGVSAPIVSGDRVYLTASDGRLNDRLQLSCYHRDVGRPLWHAEFFGSSVPEGQFPPGGMAVPTPATDGQRVYALFGTGDLVCVDDAGKPVWIRSLAQEYGPFRNRWGMAASPLLLGGLLVVQVDHWGGSYLLGVDAATGANRWRTERDTSVNWSSPLAVTVGGKTQLVTTGTHQVRGYDAETGTELWHAAGLDMQCIPSPVAGGGLVYVLPGQNKQLLALRLDGGSQIAWKARSRAAGIPSPVCYGGRLYFLEDNGWGNCLDAATGKELWRERLGGNFRASPVAGDGKVYFPGMEGVVTVVKSGPTFEVLAKNDLGEGLVASPAVAGARLFLRGEQHLFCVGE